MPRDRLGFIGLMVFLAERQLWGPDPTWAPRYLEEATRLLLVRKVSHVWKNLRRRKWVAVALLKDISPVTFSSFAAQSYRNWVTSAGRISSAGETSTWTQQTPGAFGNPSPLAYFTRTQLEGKNKFQNVQIILKAPYNSLLQSPQSLDITKFILDVKTQELICSCIKSSAVQQQNPGNRPSFC